MKKKPGDPATTDKAPPPQNDEAVRLHQRMAQGYCPPVTGPTTKP